MHLDQSRIFCFILCVICIAAHCFLKIQKYWKNLLTVLESDCHVLESKSIEVLLNCASLRRTSRDYIVYCHTAIFIIVKSSIIKFKKMVDAFLLNVFSFSLRPDVIPGLQSWALPAVGGCTIQPAFTLDICFETCPPPAKWQCTASSGYFRSCWSQSHWTQLCGSTILCSWVSTCLASCWKGSHAPFVP